MAGTEKRDLSVRGAAWLMLGIFGLLLIAAVVVRLLFGHFGAREAAAQPPPLSRLATPSGTLPPEPRLQPAPALDLIALRKQEDSLLSSYGWVDRRAGRVRVPIARAIELLAERGLPARAGEPAKEGR